MSCNRLTKIDVETRKARARFYNSPTWRKLRAERIELDNFECQWCKAEGRVSRAGAYNLDGRKIILEVDHIKELETHPECALDINNLRTLCRDCHNKRHNRFNYRTKAREQRWNDEFDIL
ncbi:HNH endonuclease [Atopobacter phocae]|uniref:HNH endonuclease n=1 Tax=Atopobacter phocae TaxID=136492 RepID=UPI000552F3F9|nr:HNH endonuclease signature motif containing protein [Atopobacter phocae]